eukprot:TRINITY_DN10014_c0_g1_i1.p1 TRINITY_DN10014_c0_g1~~TRINITY_DN10014_c0_g1_i1.p1  ORF type:complete len:404 (+),score=125.02 TRINITY_DN10014_c0_g1_i1:701-1912(+)
MLRRFFAAVRLPRPWCLSTFVPSGSLARAPVRPISMPAHRFRTPLRPEVFDEAAAANDPELAGTVESTRELSRLQRADELDAMEAHFASMPVRNQHAFSVVIKAFVRRNRLDRAAHYVQQLTDAQIGPPNSLLVWTILRHLSTNPGLEGQQHLVELIGRSGFEPSLDNRAYLSGRIRVLPTLGAKEAFVQLIGELGFGVDVAVLTSLIDASSHAGDLARARFYFKHILDCGFERGIVPCTAMLQALARAGQFDDCFAFYDELRASGTSTTAPTIVVMIMAASNANQLHRVRAFVDDTPPDTDEDGLLAVYTAALCAMAQRLDFDGVRSYLAEMQQRQLQPNVRSVLALGRTLRQLPLKLGYNTAGFAVASCLRGPYRDAVEDSVRTLTPQELTTFSVFVSKLQ